MGSRSMCIHLLPGRDPYRAKIAKSSGRLSSSLWPATYDTGVLLLLDIVTLRVSELLGYGISYDLSLISCSIW